MPAHIPQIASLGRALGHEFESEVYGYDTYFANSGRTLYGAALSEVFAHVVRPEIIVQPVDLARHPFDTLTEELPQVAAYPDSSSLERLLATFEAFVTDKHGGIFKPRLKQISTYGRAVVFTANEYMSNPCDIPKREPA